MSSLSRKPHDRGDHLVDLEKGVVMKLRLLAVPVLAIGVLLGCSSAELASPDTPANTPASTTPATTDSEVTAAPTTTTTAVRVDPEAAVAAVLGAINAYNSGDIDAWVATFAPESREAPVAETWGYFDEIFMNANQQLQVVEPCQPIATGPTVVECTIAVSDDFYGPAGLSGTAPAQFQLNDQLQLIEWNDNQECCDRQFLFNRAFNNWLRDSHPDIYEQIRPFDLESLPGWRTDPADMAIAIQYVAEFVEQSDTYPLELIDP